VRVVRRLHQGDVAERIREEPEHRHDQQSDDDRDPGEQTAGIALERRKESEPEGAEQAVEPDPEDEREVREKSAWRGCTLALQVASSAITGIRGSS
jgi:hypothetical protein